MNFQEFGFDQWVVNFLGVITGITMFICLLALTIGILYLGKIYVETNRRLQNTQIHELDSEIELNRLKYSMLAHGIDNKVVVDE